MIRSMTGFGRGEAALEGGGFLTVEIKAVNHRFNELVIRAPRQLSALEAGLRSQLQEQVSRGRLDVYVTLEPGAGGRQLLVDKELALQYDRALKEIGEAIGSKVELTAETLAALPEVFTLAEVPLSEEILATALTEAAGQALAGLLEMREQEGQHLASELRLRLAQLASVAGQLQALAPTAVTAYRERLTKRLAELLEPGVVDEGRLAIEVALFAERADVTEELDRLKSHLAQFEATLQAGGPMGRKLDFLTQELTREVNTIGSKAQATPMIDLVIEAKAEIEKIREQVQNLE